MKNSAIYFMLRIMLLSSLSSQYFLKAFAH